MKFLCWRMMVKKLIGSSVLFGHVVYDLPNRHLSEMPGQ